MNTCTKFRQVGFSLIELMIGVAIIAILVSVAMPNFQIWVQNNKVRTAAESVLDGLQRARSEAIKQNGTVAFTLTNPLVDSSWSIAGVENRSGGEGSKNVTITPVAADLATPATTVTFNSLGMTVFSAASIAQIDFQIAGSSKKYRVTIGVWDPVNSKFMGSNPRMCDPDQATGHSSSAC